MHRKAVSVMLLILLVVSISTSAFNILTVKATGTIYIRADGSVDPPTAPIQRAGNVYTFSANIYDSIVVEKNDITIDGANFALQGPGLTSASIAIEMSGRSGVTIRNVKIDGFAYGIHAFPGTRSSNIVGNEISANSYNGIMLEGSDNVITDNEVSSTYQPITVSGSSNSITDNICLGNTLSSIYIGRGSNILISDNSVCGIVLIDSSQNTIENNIMSGVGDRSIDVIGIQLSSSNNNNVIRNTVSNKHVGFDLNGANGNLVEDNLVTNDGSEGTVGIDIDQSHSNSITGNTLSLNWDGISMADSSNNIISANKITDNCRHGIDVRYSANNNIIYHNVFVDNHPQVFSYLSANDWDRGYSVGGNFWDDYTGVDLKKGLDQDQPGSDGIGDTPYVIDGNNRDRYPLMNTSPFLSDRAVELAKQVIGAPYHQERGEPSTKGCIWEKGEGYHFFTPQQIKNGYPTKEPGLDCSGLIFWAYNRADFGDGYTRDREAFFVYYEGAEMQYKGNCRPITKEELQPGDLLFFDTSDFGDPDHVAMYVGTFTYGDKTYNTIEATAYGDKIITVASFDSSTGALTTLKPSTGATRQLPVKYYGRVIGHKVAMKIAGKSPVDLTVTDPEGVNLTKDMCEAGGMCYLEYDVDGDDELDAVIAMPERKVGDYLITVIPHLNASPTDVYTLEVSGPNGTIILAANTSISNVPTQPYRVSSTETSVLLFTDINRDGTVNILDITIVATAYGTTAEDSKWNESADLERSGVINILDISMVAKDYGKTV